MDGCLHFAALKCAIHACPPRAASGSLSAKSHGSSKWWQHHALSWFLAGTGPSTMDSTTTYPCLIHPCRERTPWWMLKSIKQICFFYKSTCMCHVFVYMQKKYSLRSVLNVATCTTDLHLASSFLPTVFPDRM